MGMVVISAETVIADSFNNQLSHLNLTNLSIYPSIIGKSTIIPKVDDADSKNPTSQIR